MTREIRREAGGWDYRLPGGKVFDSLDEFNKFREGGIDVAEKAKEAALNEGRQEAGITGGSVEFLELSKAGASVEWDLHYFLVTNAVIGDQDLEEVEKGDIQTVVLTGKEIFEKLVNREIKEGRSADMLWLWLEKNKIISLDK
jgi:8-oxo-dGTP pyrophosphatase MutT (NUDIX family)